MSQILEAIGQADVAIRSILYELLGQSDAFADLLATIKGASPSEQRAFYAELEPPIAAYLKQQVARTPDPGAETLQAAEATLRRTLEEARRMLAEADRHVDDYHEAVRATRALLRAGAHPPFAYRTDQARGLPVPAAQEPLPDGVEVLALPAPDRSIVDKVDVFDCIAERASRRQYTGESLSLAELSYLLWATQGLRKVLGDGQTSVRTAPSAGARQPFETYLVVDRVDGLKPGVYRYLPFGHRLAYLFAEEDMAQKLSRAAGGQDFVGQAPVCFVWAAVPYRTEWRYALNAAKYILLDAGHVCQNLYLACESIGCGTCAIGAYDQAAMDGLLRLDGVEQCVVYLAPAGHVPA